MSSELPEAAPPVPGVAVPLPRPLSGTRIVVTLVVVVAMAGLGYVGEILAAFGSYPTCASTPPPGPPAFLIASGVITVICGAAPALAIGIRRGWPTVIAFAGGAIVPFAICVFVASRTNRGFCF